MHPHGPHCAGSRGLLLPCCGRGVLRGAAGALLRTLPDCVQRIGTALPYLVDIMISNRLMVAKSKRPGTEPQRKTRFLSVPQCLRASVVGFEVVFGLNKKTSCRKTGGRRKEIRNA